MELNEEEKTALVWNEYHNEEEFEGKKRWVEVDSEDIFSLWNPSNEG